MGRSYVSGVLWRVEATRMHRGKYGAPPRKQSKDKKAGALVRRIVKAASKEDTQKKKSTEGYRNPSPEASGIKDGSDTAGASSGPISKCTVDEEEDESNSDAEEDDLVGTKAKRKTKKDNLARSVKDHRRVLDIILNPPIVETSLMQLEYAKPETQLEFPSFYASIIDFYAQDGLAFLRRLRDVNQVIYGNGPKKIMELARKGIKDKTGPTQTADKKNLEKDFTLRWIHLPANNLQWMEDLALRMFIDDGEPKDAYEELYNLLHGSWHEVPHASFESKFMKPACSTNLGPRWGNKGKPKNEATKSSPIEEAGENGKNITTAKDEAATEAEKKKKAEAEKKKKAEENKCQIALYVVTVELNNGTALKEESNSWTILRVDQLWLWVLNEKYIITSSTHRMDDADDIVPSAIISYLTNNSRSKTQPNSAVALTKLIVDFCIGFFNHLQADTDTKTEAGRLVQKSKGRRSTQQIFSDAINRASIKEAELFRNFVNRHDRNKARDKDQASNKGQAGDKDQRGDENESKDKRLKSIEEAARLLRDVKDIRDELNILRLIASYQMTVQDSLPTSAGTTHIDRDARSIAASIEELDKLAKKIEGAVNATLSVEQSAVAIEQSKETVQQGRTLMTFTIVTILFKRIRELLADLSPSPSTESDAKSAVKRDWFEEIWRK
ncbi:unnamed protein product [Parascedosporium putredinis]|uniref:Uncharacterized protein n=1 Tax=Parascedosporium putredinis TaxID=1442378 RepID=A0A9P1H533_9PEZI|nr:unnamed protein product [Parascedosporium putredinis]CAI7997379.1 unnamed protein product [Parascedosporium putredinis]